MTGLPAKATGPPLGMGRNQIIRKLNSVEAALAAERERSKGLEGALETISALSSKPTGCLADATALARAALARPVGGQE